MGNFKENQRKRESEQQNKLKKVNYNLWRECVETANMIAINNNLSLQAGADIENNLIYMVLKAIGTGKARL